ncbi:hypothetical protein BDE36_1787 [Arcticibacter tournemirensis]|uniref:Uncharacterized protein n=1 Tax=Arcticibacter tournemirensis TaxID=699437 RepID=A0A5M9HBJ4_9SPHI|nr:hypothetical protein [Arcticibacter tournemirensis]KAA8483749.1 hypothetical protein F1649_07625 [Arcticibacter tournemirensis]TQM50052.1 hypothetical protein BDE36_1787 [Arcticibacter tournemirensis]
MDAKILLPVRPHIKKYLEVQFGKQLAVSSRGYIPHLLRLMLEKHEKMDPSKVRPSQRMIDDKNFVGYPIYVGSSLRKTKGSFISEKNILAFNEDVDDHLKEEMFRFIHAHPGKIDSVVDYNIIRFRDFYDISEDELSFDALKRWYYRNRQRIDERKHAPEPFIPQLILTF